MYLKIGSKEQAISNVASWTLHNLSAKSGFWYVSSNSLTSGTGFCNFD